MPIAKELYERRITFEDLQVCKHGPKVELVITNNTAAIKMDGVEGRLKRTVIHGPGSFAEIETKEMFYRRVKRLAKLLDEAAEYYFRETS